MVRHSLLLLLVLGTKVLAEEPGSTSQQAPPAPADEEDSAEALAKKTQNPVADLITVPFQSNTNFGVAPGNGVQEVLNIQPVIPIHMGSFNLITRTIIPVISQPNTGEGGEGNTFGLGNITTTLFFSPAKPGGFVWGIGPIFGFPTNTSPELGYAKWTFGPAVVVLSMPGPWVLGLLVSNQWSWAGGGSLNVNLMTLQYFINYNFADGWYLTSSPLITANWLASPYGEKWTFPVGGGFGKLVRLGRLPINLNLAAYYNIWHPSGGPTWQLRATLAFLF